MESSQLEPKWEWDQVKANGMGNQESGEAALASGARDIESAESPERLSATVLRSSERAPISPPSSAAQAATTFPLPMRVREDDEDAVTTVDGALAPPTETQRAELSRRIRSALGQTLPLGTRVPEGVRPAPPDAASGRSHAFKRTLLLGTPARTDAASSVEVPPGAAPSTTPSAPPPSAAPSPVAPANVETTEVVRASFVRPIGPPTSPPPRRLRRVSSVSPIEQADADDTEMDDEHEAFQLDRRSSPPAARLTPLPWRAEGESDPWLSLKATPRREVTIDMSGPAFILPPPPQEPDAAASAPSRFPHAAFGRAPVPSSHAAPSNGAHHGSRAGEAPLPELPNVDPFVGFAAPEQSWWERWMVVLVIALALVGAAAIAAIVLGYLSPAR